MQQRPITILHTGDWHLGQTLYGRSRREEHARFLAWLIREIAQRRIDALMIAGDVFDSANPSGEALGLYYDLVAQLARECPWLTTYVIAGNHDSAARLQAPAQLLASMNVHVVTQIGYQQRGGLETLRAEDVVRPLRMDGEIRAYLALVPFLRPSDLPSAYTAPEAEGTRSMWERGVAAVYEQVHRFLQGLPEQVPHVALGHLELKGAQLSTTSERVVMGGQALPASVFGTGFDYVGLGHLHLAQPALGHPHIHYAGSPIALSFAETNYHHSVRLVEFSTEKKLKVTVVDVPRSRALVRIGYPVAVSASEALDAIRNIENAPLETWVDLRIAVATPDTKMRRAFEQALEKRNARLVKMTVDRPQVERTVRDDQPAATTPMEMFVAKRRRDHTVVALHDESMGHERQSHAASPQDAADLQAQALVTTTNTLRAFVGATSTEAGTDTAVAEASPTQALPPKDEQRLFAQALQVAFERLRGNFGSLSSPGIIPSPTTSDFELEDPAESSADTAQAEGAADDHPDPVAELPS